MNETFQIIFLIVIALITVVFAVYLIYVDSRNHTKLIEALADAIEEATKNFENEMNSKSDSV